MQIILWQPKPAANKVTAVRFAVMTRAMQHASALPSHHLRRHQTPPQLVKMDRLLEQGRTALAPKTPRCWARYPTAPITRGQHQHHAPVTPWPGTLAAIAVRAQHLAAPPPETLAPAMYLQTAMRWLRTTTARGLLNFIVMGRAERCRSSPQVLTAQLRLYAPQAL